ncbi:hypothetical protein BpHYR1_014388 [Brachionus plicatilis]|uniref:Uncharacterized protein n=1 Tax=Brachionus plicatilis TaxID=10195 RepID=A0A3M7RLW4_BRAPC|nr:hypothetical protein BpHYR1_014388 [Brachionus plicatilis]
MNRLVMVAENQAATRNHPKNIVSQTDKKNISYFLQFTFSYSVFLFKSNVCWNTLWCRDIIKTNDANYHPPFT